MELEIFVLLPYDPNIRRVKCYVASVWMVWSNEFVPALLSCNVSSLQFIITLYLFDENSHDAIFCLPYYDKLYSYNMTIINILVENIFILII
jgi:hypothetical protein